jgi:hypothetical protein
VKISKRKTKQQNKPWGWFSSGSAINVIGCQVRVKQNYNPQKVCGIVACTAAKVLKGCNVWCPKETHFRQPSPIVWWRGRELPLVAQLSPKILRRHPPCIAKKDCFLKGHTLRRKRIGHVGAIWSMVGCKSVCRGWAASAKRVHKLQPLKVELRLPKNVV